MVIGCFKENTHICIYNNSDWEMETYIRDVLSNSTNTIVALTTFTYLTQKNNLKKNKDERMFPYKSEPMQMF